jgi:hypothetical protein
VRVGSWAFLIGSVVQIAHSVSDWSQTGKGEIQEWSEATERDVEKVKDDESEKEKPGWQVRYVEVSETV